MDRLGEHGARARRLQPAIGHALLALLLLLLPLVAAAAQPAAPAKRTVLVVGDSLSAAYGLRHDEGWVVLLANQVAAEHPDWQVANSSISGQTSADGASHLLKDLQRLRPQVVVIELGANDGLRGLPLLQTRMNLARMIGMAHGAGARVLLLGLRMPPNYGPAYVRDFESMYPELAKKFDVALLPFFLEPVAGDRANFQDDNLHPVARVQPLLRDHVWKSLEPLMR
jgi:acyl-CoA thioesterase-1